MLKVLFDENYKTKPYISVIIIAYNRKKYILDAIKSVINQTLSKDKYEIIVIKNFKDDKIDDFINKNNIKNLYSLNEGLGAKIVEALNYSHGEIISFLEDDDLFLNNKLEYVYTTFKQNPLVCFVRNEIIKTRIIKITKTNINYSINLEKDLKKFYIQRLNTLSKIYRLIEKFGANVNISSISIRKNEYIKFISKISQSNFLLDTWFFVLPFFFHNDAILAFIHRPLSVWRIHTSASNIGEYSGLEEFINKNTENAKKSYNEIIKIQELAIQLSENPKTPIIKYLQLSKIGYTSVIKFMESQKFDMESIMSILKIGYYHRDFLIFISSFFMIVSIFSPHIYKKISRMAFNFLVYC